MDTTLGDSQLTTLISEMMQTGVESDDIIESLENVASDCADSVQSSKTEVSCHTENANVNITETAASGNKPHMCDPCTIDETENIACAFCIVCIEYMCERCYRDHIKHKATRNHKVLKDDIPVEPRVFKYIRKMMTCSKHEEYEVTHKCEDHNIYICVLCTAGIHRKCENVIELSETFSSSEDRASEARLKIKELQKENQQISMNRNSNILDLTTEKKEIAEKVSDIVTQFTSDLLEMKNKLVNEVDQVTEKQMNHLKEDAGKCKNFEDEYRLFREVIETVEHYGSNIEINMMLTVIKNNLDEMEQEIEEQRKKEGIHLRFTRNKNCHLMQDLGTLEVQCESDGAEKKKSVENVSEGGLLDGDNMQNVEVEFDKLEDFCVKIGDDFFSCSITGCVVLDNGTILVTDEENRKIKAYNPYFEYICGIVLTAPPVDICITDINIVAVVYKIMKKIEFLMINAGQFSKYRELPTKFENSRITATRRYKQIALLYTTSYCARGCIQIRDYSGQVINDISLDNLFGPADREECGLCYTSDGLVVVSRSTGVMCLTPRRFKNCVTKWTFALDENIEVTRHISSDENGNIYICSPSKNCIYQISRDCVKPTVLKMPSPLSIAVDQDRKKNHSWVFQKKLCSCWHKYDSLIGVVYLSTKKLVNWIMLYRFYF